MRCVSTPYCNNCGDECDSITDDLCKACQKIYDIGFHNGIAKAKEHMRNLTK